MKICSIEGCDRKAIIKGWCRKHYSRWQAHGTTDLVIKVTNKDRTCSIVGCQTHVHSMGLCQHHYLRQWRYGDANVITVPFRAKGTGTITPDGYMKKRRGNDRPFEHRFIVEQYLGIILPWEYVVHHKDGYRLNNSLSNLAPVPRSLHGLIHRMERAFIACGHADWGKCVFCKQYAPFDELVSTNNIWMHNDCRNEHSRAYYATRRETVARQRKIIRDRVAMKRALEGVL